MRGQKFHHCDLACRNVKVGKGLVAKMADFGMAVHQDNRDKYLIYQMILLK